MIDRKIDAYFDRFFKRTKKAVLVTGARQIGKTYSIRAAARRNFDYFVEVNFITSPEAVGITQVPRESGHEELIIAYLQKFAAERNLQCKTDKAGNVLIVKEAACGKENLPGVVLQSHSDMVCEKNEGVEHDFRKDPIKYIIKDGWMIAPDTTLGSAGKSSENRSRSAELINIYNKQTTCHNKKFTAAKQKYHP